MDESKVAALAAGPICSCHRAARRSAARPRGLAPVACLAHRSPGSTAGRGRSTAAALPRSRAATQTVPRSRPSRPRAARAPGT
eukprot:scaffold49522_cov54-Phaeocystis_antarctica.AAC.3